MTASDRALVTGATGFIGSHLALRLMRQGVRVRGLARSAAKGPWLIERGVELVEGDLTDAASLRRAVEGCSVIFSVAGWTGRRGSWNVARRVNVDGTRALVETAIGAGAKRIVHTSSLAVYGYHAGGVIEEDWPLQADEPYGATKAQSEAIVFGGADRIEGVVLRPAQVFGPRSGLWTATLFGAVKRGLPILIDGGHGTCHPCYIDNLIDAYWLAATRSEAVGEAFTIVDGVTTWREFIGHYARMAGRRARSTPALVVKLALTAYVACCRLARRPPSVTRGWLDFAVGRARYSHDKASRLLGWSPRVSLDEGMRRTEAWLRETGRLG